MCSTKTALRIPRDSDSASHTSLTYTLVSFLRSLKEPLLVVWQVTLIGTCSFYYYPFYGKIKPIFVFGYLDAVLRTDERVIATHFSLKISNELARVS